jgi:hypothetical protein
MPFSCFLKRRPHGAFSIIWPRFNCHPKYLFLALNKRLLFILNRIIITRKTCTVGIGCTQVVLHFIGNNDCTTRSGRKLCSWLCNNFNFFNCIMASLLEKRSTHRNIQWSAVHKNVQLFSLVHHSSNI